MRKIADNPLSKKMPDKPLWLGRLDSVIGQLQQVESPWVDSALLEHLLGISRRRAQQLLQPLVRHVIGKNGLALKQDVVQHLKNVAAGQDAFYEKSRRERLHSILDSLHQELKTTPRVLVEAPASVVNHDMNDLPEGIRLSPGRIVIQGFSTTEEALQRILELGMAMGNDMDGFEKRVGIT